LKPRNSSDVVETVTFETETETWLKFRDETETSLKLRHSRLEVRDWDSRLQNLCILPKFFKKMSSSLLTTGVRRGVNGHFPYFLYFSVWHSHCTTDKFTVLVSSSGELAVHSCSLLCVAKLGSEFFLVLGLLRNNIIAANLQRFASSYDRRRFTACCFWTLVPRI